MIGNKEFNSHNGTLLNRRDRPRLLHVVVQGLFFGREQFHVIVKRSEMPRILKACALGKIYSSIGTKKHTMAPHSSDHPKIPDFARTHFPDSSMECVISIGP